jgi:hypothetical protein
LLRAIGTKHDARYNLKFVDNGEPRPERDSTAAPAATPTSSDDDAVVTKPQNDDLDYDDTSVSEHDVKESDVISKTRKELEDLDDLDI